MSGQFPSLSALRRLGQTGLVLSALGLAEPVLAAPKPPNIVVILVDDAALMDFSAYGGEARMPNIDRLAGSGAMFTNYHTSPLCSPSRSMLLTGLDNHRAGVATIEEILPAALRSHKGYGLHFEPGVWTLADRLKRSGYRTMMAGKWHLGHGPGDLPNSHGFDQSLALDASGADNWRQKSYMPYYKDAPWFENGVPVKLPELYYSSDLIESRLERYIDAEPAGGAPFLAYMAFQAVHIPVQAPASYSDHYRGQFDGGWAALRADRTRRARALGLIPENAPVADLRPETRAWAALKPDERQRYARAMEVYSGMIEAMDASVGRLMQHLKARGELDNTLFVVTSDNGPEYSNPVAGNDLWMSHNGYKWSLEGQGEDGSLNFIGPEWAAAVAAPGRLFKFYTAEGGIHVPLIVSGPGVKPGIRVGSNAFVTDITPTLVDYAGAIPPGAEALAMDGSSLRPVLTGDSSWTHAPDQSVGIEVSGNAALFRGSWKLVREMPPLGDGKWRLYDLARDPGETHDLSIAEPAQMKLMLADYAAYEARVGVMPLPKSYSPQKQLLLNILSRQVQFIGSGRLALVGLGLLALIGLVLAGVRRMRRKP